MSFDLQQRTSNGKGFKKMLTKPFVCMHTLRKCTVNGKDTERMLVTFIFFRHFFRVKGKRVHVDMVQSTI